MIPRNYHVYLAGPISGLDFAGAVDWRDMAKSNLEHWSVNAGIKTLSPMRFEDHLSHETNMSPMGCDSHVLSTPRGIMTRDRFDCTRSDVVLVNLLGAKRVSIGTVMEIGWADLSRVPVVCCMEAEGNPHDHAMVTEAIGFRVTTLADGLEVVKAILS